MVAKLTKKKLNNIWLEDVPQDKVFWCHDHRVVKNLDELVLSFREMSEETYSYHITEDNNDFINWIKDVIGDITLAKDLQKAATPIAAAVKVDKRLGWLRAKLSDSMKFLTAVVTCRQ